MCDAAVFIFQLFVCAAVQDQVSSSLQTLVMIQTSLLVGKTFETVTDFARICVVAAAMGNLMACTIWL